MILYNTSIDGETNPYYYGQVTSNTDKDNEH